MTDRQMSEAMAAIVGEEHVLQGRGAQRAYDCDAYTVDRSKPTVVVLPGSTQEVAEIVRWCNRAEIPFTGRGAGTGLSGGALPALGGVVVSTKRLTKILEIDIPNRCLKAEAGIANKRLTDAVRDHGLHFAPDPSSQSVSTLGGNIAENAGGPHTLKYGVTAQHILGVTMVEPSGEILQFGGPAGCGSGFDFIPLIVGSEGTLGIVTEAWVKLTPLPTAVETALVAFATVRDATQSVADIIAAGVIPAALELMDHGILVALSAAFGLQYPEGAAALLLVECDSALEGDEAATRVAGEMATATRICQENGAMEITIAQSEAERQKLWMSRKKGVGAMGRLAPSIVTHDGVIPRSKLPEMLDFVYGVAEKHGVKVANLFHAGDGNLHPCFYFDDRDGMQVQAVIEAGEEIIRRCVELGGSVTGEHGVGVEKQDLLPLMFSPDDLRFQAMTKQIINEGDLCNPCKVLPNQKSCVEHKKRWRGVAW